MLKLVRMPVDTGAERVCFLHRACTKAVAEALMRTGKVEIKYEKRSLRCTLNIVNDASLLSPDALGLSERTFDDWGVGTGCLVEVLPAGEPPSRLALRTKVGGGTLSDEQIDSIIEDIGAGYYSDHEITGFLIATANGLDDSETVALARSRARRAHQLAWPQTLVVDKHSMGGIPGTRVSMVVIPIAIAGGLTIPKTASRAITSAAGTADAMEGLARVDLDADEVRRVVAVAGGCIVWNGRLSHSRVDEIMNAMTRPLGVDSDRLSVVSIISKKVAAGATHVVIDIPVGRTAKIKTNIEAAEIARLFRLVADALGLAVAVEITDGSQPIGRGVGPALEARDVMAVLSNAPEAPADLREKSLRLAARMLEFSGQLDSAATLEQATSLLDGGAALQAMERIIDAQGRNSVPPSPGSFTHEIEATASGRIQSIDCFRISGIARRAGAPSEKSAGIDLFKRAGDVVVPGEPLYRIHAARQDELEAALAYARNGLGFHIVGA